ncbi:Rne/Rng family ribonuclease [Gemmobacter denitrificans]|uniref:Ribonuclease E n=1 Tax=Gemmobacter denitrificans TaxID=3123040 RepID=A0ABU8BYW2_9RHOB
MAKKMLIDATHPEETRVVVVDGNKVEEFDFETVNKRQLQGNIYLAKVTRVEPSLQAAFVDYGGNRHGFLAFAEIHPDYYQIPVADRKALLEEERALARAEEEEENRPRNRRPAPKPKAPRAEAQAEAVVSEDAVITGEVPAQAEAVHAAPAGMDVVDLGEETGADALFMPAQDSRAEPARDPRAELASERAEGSGYAAVDHASDVDDEIESVAEEDVSEEIRAPRKPRARRYKIQEVIKVRQIMLVQVVKEERGNKGAALTTYLSLAGRYCVLMPNTARGGGISRKITQAADRKKLKEIASEMEVPEGAGLIIRTAGAKRTKAEIKRDYEYLMRLWEQVRELTLKSIAPAPIYEEGDLIKRSIRDLYNREIEEILVEGEAGYRTAKDFMRMIMPNHARVVQRYQGDMPLFARHQVESYLAGMFNPVVQLKSGGYIVIGVTEALVAIDVNSGRATKEGSIEDTALKTNLEAADEVARQLRLRDLAGLIVIDFIDMEERRNNAAVEKRLKDKLKTDRARIQVGRISGFGLMEMSRQRLRPGMLESTTQPCPHCHGTGLIRSDDSLALTILRALEEEGTRKRSREVLLRAPVAVINYLINQKREHVALIEGRYGMAVRLEADPQLVSPDYSIEKFKTATRVVPESTVISANAALMGALIEEEDDPELPLEDEEEDEVVETTAAPKAAVDPQPEGEGTGNGSKKKRRRRPRRRGGAKGQEGDVSTEDGDDSADVTEPSEDAAVEDAAAPVEAAEPVVTEGQAADAAETPAEPAPKAKSSRSGGKSASTRGKSKAKAASVPEADSAAVASVEQVAETPAPEGEAVAEAPAKPKAKPASSRTKSASGKTGASKSRSKAVAEPDGAAEAAAPQPAMPASDETIAAPAEMAPAAPVTEAPVAETVVPPAPVLQADPGDVPVASGLTVDPEASTTTEADESKPRRKGWWSMGR